ncbi:fluoride efflux transporter CrcB [Thermomonospora catenispora]|uniref:fluoride efflux transporter CrcB n=1 Tax=Thermomonospora catenispora TaxID=2493090 RepID=UPI00111CE13F|nr:fluoride efflux transporter CrcB [Thermomonospora catenispora]TNY37607.1 fluoride efflux transporter CrcB [Thermomonospora catenispora]
MTVLWVLLGAAVGAPLRYLADRWARSRFGDDFPWGTLGVNVLGSGMLGLLAALPAGAGLTAFAGAGLCGALTTYSTFGYETVRLLEDGARRRALVYVVVSVFAALAAAAAGAVVASFVGA